MNIDAANPILISFLPKKPARPASGVSSAKKETTPDAPDISQINKAASKSFDQLEAWEAMLPNDAAINPHRINETLENLIRSVRSDFKSINIADANLSPLEIIYNNPDTYFGNIDKILNSAENDPENYVRIYSSLLSTKDFKTSYGLKFIDLGDRNIELTIKGKSINLTPGKDPWFCANFYSLLGSAGIGHAQYLEKTGKIDEAQGFLLKTKKHLLDAEIHILKIFGQIPPDEYANKDISGRIKLINGFINKLLTEKPAKGFSDRDEAVKIFTNLEVQLLNIEGKSTEMKHLNKKIISETDVTNAIKFYGGVKNLKIGDNLLISYFDPSKKEAKNPWLKSNYLINSARSHLSYTFVERAASEEERLITPKKNHINISLSHSYEALKYILTYYSGGNTSSLSDKVKDRELTYAHFKSVMNNLKTSAKEAKNILQLYIFAELQVAEANAQYYFIALQEEDLNRTIPKGSAQYLAEFNKSLSILKPLIDNGYGGVRVSIPETVKKALNDLEADIKRVLAEREVWKLLKNTLNEEGSAIKWIKFPKGNPARPSLWNESADNLLSALDKVNIIKKESDRNIVLARIQLWLARLINLSSEEELRNSAISRNLIRIKGLAGSQDPSDAKNILYEKAIKYFESIPSNFDQNHAYIEIERAGNSKEFGECIFSRSFPQGIAKESSLKNAASALSKACNTFRTIYGRLKNGQLSPRNSDYIIKAFADSLANQADVYLELYQATKKPSFLAGANQSINAAKGIIITDTVLLVSEKIDRSDIPSTVIYKEPPVPDTIKHFVNPASAIDDIKYNRAKKSVPIIEGIVKRDPELMKKNPFLLLRNLDVLSHLTRSYAENELNAGIKECKNILSDNLLADPRNFYVKQKAYLLLMDLLAKTKSFGIAIESGKDFLSEISKLPPAYNKKNIGAILQAKLKIAEYLFIDKDFKASEEYLNQVQSDISNFNPDNAIDKENNLLLNAKLNILLSKIALQRRTYDPASRHIGYAKTFLDTLKKGPIYFPDIYQNLNNELSLIDAQNKLATRDPSIAETALNGLMAASINRSFFQYAIALIIRTHVLSKDLERAISAGEKALDIYKNNPEYLDEIKMELADAYLEKGNFKKVDQFCKEILDKTSLPYLMKKAVYLYNKRLAKDGTKKSISQINKTYSAWEEGSLKGKSVSININFEGDKPEGKTYSNIESLDSINDDYILADAKIIKIKDILNQSDFTGFDAKKAQLENAKTLVRELLNGKYEPFIKKQALLLHCDILSRQSFVSRKIYNENLKKSLDIYSTWLSASPDPITGTISIAIDGNNYSGIEAVNPSCDSDILANIFLSNLKHFVGQNDFGNAVDIAYKILSKKFTDPADEKAMSYIKKQALVSFLDLLGRQEEDVEANIRYANEIGSEWKNISKNADSGGLILLSIKMKIKGVDTTVSFNIEPINLSNPKANPDKSNDSYIESSLALIEIKDKINQFSHKKTEEDRNSAFASVKVLILPILANKYEMPYIKKQALQSYCDLLLRKATKESCDEAYTILSAWKTHTGELFSVDIDRVKYEGIE